MTRIDKIQKKTITPKFKEFYSAVESLLGRVPNFYKTLSNSPLLAMAFCQLMRLLRENREGTSISGKIKKLIVIKTSHTNGCQILLCTQYLTRKSSKITDGQIKAISLNEFFKTHFLKKYSHLNGRA